METALFEFEAIGTHWKIDIIGPLSSEDQRMILGKLVARIDQFDHDYSRFRSDSLVTKISKKAGTYQLPADAEPMLATYRKLYELSHGLFTPLIGQVLVDAGYDPHYSLQPRTLHVPPNWDEALKYDKGKIKTKMPILLDFGAGGKGYLIDIVGEILSAEDIHTYSIDAGGDILFTTDTKDALRVGLEHPLRADEVIGVATIANQSICGSAGNRRHWSTYHHIINPVSLTSPKNILAVWVVAKTALVADALSTCLFFVEPFVLEQHFDFEFLLVRDDNNYEQSKHFPAEIFTA